MKTKTVNIYVLNVIVHWHHPRMRTYHTSRAHAKIKQSSSNRARRIAEPTVFARSLAIVALLAECLVVVRTPEQSLIAAVRENVVNHARCKNAAL